MRMDIRLRFDYGRTVPWVTRIADGIRAVAGPDLAVLHASVPVHGRKPHHRRRLHRHTWRRASGSRSPTAPRTSQTPIPSTPSRRSRILKTSGSLDRACSNTKASISDLVERSLITLKALTFRPTGGIIAAPTTSLPESIGGVRNWDYRYCWLRDTTFTLLALANGGYYKEAAAWQNWLLRALAGSPDQVQIMYGLKGERQLVEWEVDWLPGYEDSKPGAHRQCRRGANATRHLRRNARLLLPRPREHGAPHGKTIFACSPCCSDHLETIWQHPDEGIWETRGGPQQFTYSKMMAWVAFDRAVKIAEQLGFHKPHRRAGAAPRHHPRRGLRKRLQSEAQQLRAVLWLRPARRRLCCSCPMVGFLPGSDPRVKCTVEAIERELMPDG